MRELTSYAACNAAATICPRPCKWWLERPGDIDLWPFDLRTGAKCQPWHGQPFCQFWCFNDCSSVKWTLSNPGHSAALNDFQNWFLNTLDVLKCTCHSVLAFVNCQYVRDSLHAGHNATCQKPVGPLSLNKRMRESTNNKTSVVLWHRRSGLIRYEINDGDGSVLSNGACDG